MEFPDGLLYIGSEAFVDQGPDYVIPASVIEIGANALCFEELNYSLVPSDYSKIYGFAGSVAEQYAEINGISFVTITE